MRISGWLFCAALTLGLGSIFFRPLLILALPLFVVFVLVFWFLGVFPWVATLLLTPYLRMDQDPHVKDRATTGLYMMYGSILGRFGVLIVPDLMEASSELLMEALITGVLTFIAAFGTMAFLMNFLKKASMLVFVIYRVAMGVLLLWMF